MPAPQNLEYIDLIDFTPGIYSNYAFPGPTAAPDGAAQEQDTYSCYGAMSGGLFPLPRLVETQARGLDTGTFPDSLQRLQILDAICVSPVIPSGAETVQFDFSGIPDQIFFMAQEYRDAAAGVSFDRITRCISYRQYLSNPTSFDVNTLTRSFSPELPPSRYFYGYASLDFGVNRLNNTDANSLYPVVLGMHQNIDTANAAAIFTYPNAAGNAPSSDAVNFVTSTEAREPRLAMFHQSRIVVAGLAPGDTFGVDFGGAGDLQAAELIDFWRPGREDSKETGATPAQYAIEQYTGWGSWTSAANNELFVVRQHGGAFVVRGDLANPNVIRLPGIPSTYSAVNVGAATPLGYVFGTRNGVYVWNGGDQAQLLSPQLDGWFWKIQDGGWDRHYPDAMKGRFGCVPPWVLVPNNWIMDVRTNGWYRLTDPNVLPYAHYAASALGHFYAFPAFIDSGRTSIFQRFDPELGALSYSWRSHPLARTRNRILNFREIQIASQGHGTILVELIGLEGKLYSKTFTINSDTVKVLRDSSAVVDAHDVEIRITSTGDENTTAPPTLRIGLGFRPTKSV